MLNFPGDFRKNWHVLQMKTLQLFADSKHIVFGSDFCVAKMAPVIIKNLTKDVDFNKGELDDMEFGNCLQLFPALKKYCFLHNIV